MDVITEDMKSAVGEEDADDRENRGRRFAVVTCEGKS